MRPNAPPKFNSRQASASRDIVTDLELITPMLGGGHTAGAIDRLQPWRASEVKAQLRFWWRALRPLDTTAADLRQREIALFGGPGAGGDDEGKASSVTVLLSVTKAQEPKLARGNDRAANAGCPAYGIRLLLQETEASLEVLAEARGQLSLRFHQAASDLQVGEVRLAFLAWLFFGGIGARTRRGFGSVFSPTWSTKGNWDELLATFNRSSGTASATPSWPSLHDCLLYQGHSGPKVSASTLWCDLVQALGTFRQGPRIGRASGTGNRPGRSFWPEADSIRNEIRFHHHAHPVEHPSASPGWFPRTAFGMPLAIVFKGNHGIDPDGTAMLQPIDGDRWPSSLILKTVSFADAPSQQIGLWLSQAPPDFAMKWNGRPNHPPPLPATAKADAFSGKTLRAQGRIPIESGIHPIAAFAKHADLKAIL